jgi:hypothetical protein
MGQLALWAQCGGSARRASAFRWRISEARGALAGGLTRRTLIISAHTRDRAGLLVATPQLLELEPEPVLLKLVHQHMPDPHRLKSGPQDCDKILVEFILNILVCSRSTNWKYWKHTLKLWSIAVFRHCLVCSWAGRRSQVAACRGRGEVGDPAAAAVVPPSLASSPPNG